MTPEASTALDEYLQEREYDGEKLDSDSLVFRNHYRSGREEPKSMTTSTVKQVIEVMAKTNLSRKKIGKRYNIQIAHGLRKRFATIVKLNNKIGYSVSERLLGHKSGLDSAYFRPDIKQDLFNEFKKIIPDLIVDDSNRLLEKNRAKDEVIKKIELENNIRIAKLENDLRQVYDLLS